MLKHVLGGSRLMTWVFFKLEEMDLRWKICDVYDIYWSSPKKVRCMCTLVYRISLYICVYTYVCVFRCCLTLDLQIQESIQQATLGWFPTKGGHPINPGMFVLSMFETPPGAEVANCPRDFSRDGFVAGQRSAAWPGWGAGCTWGSWKVSVKRIWESSSDLQYTDSWCVCFCLRYLCICWIDCLFIHLCKYICHYLYVYACYDKIWCIYIYIYIHVCASYQFSWNQIRYLWFSSHI